MLYKSELVIMNEVEMTSQELSKLKKLNVKSINIESDLYVYEDIYLIKKFLDDDEEFLKEKKLKVDRLVQKKIAGTFRFNQRFVLIINLLMI